MKSNLKTNQKGMVSIIVTMVLIILMTLIVLGMSQNSNRERRQALDRQLSDQAFYNAESGINDWVDFLYRNSSDPTVPDDRTDCSAVLPAGVNSQIDGATGVNSYSCLLYDKSPDSIIFTLPDLSDSKVVPITPSATLNELVFMWTTPIGSASVGGCNPSLTVLPQDLGNNCNVGGIRVELVNTSIVNRTAIQNNNFVAYFLPGPSSSAGTMPYTTPDKQGAISQAKCDATGICTQRLTGVGLTAGTSMVLHLKSLYAPNKVTVNGLDISGNKVEFRNAQIMLDSTGKANDVLRRVQVRVPANSQYDYADNALRTVDSICKLITVDRDMGTASLDPRCT